MCKGITAAPSRETMPPEIPAEPATLGVNGWVRSGGESDPKECEDALDEKPRISCACSAVSYSSDGMAIPAELGMCDG